MSETGDKVVSDRDRVLAACPGAYTGVGDGEIFCTFPPDGSLMRLGDNWTEATKHQLVVAFEAQHRPASQPLAVEPQDREMCQHCGLRVYATWKHHGSNLEPCYGGKDTFASPSIKPEAPEGAKDTERLDWLAENEAHLHTHREKFGEGYGIWWNVVRRNKSISGHPLGSPRAAIDEAMKLAVREADAVQWVESQPFRQGGAK